MLSRFILPLIFFQKVPYQFFIHSCFIYFDIDGNEAVCDVELEVNDDKKLDYKLIDDVENVDQPKAGMLFSSLKEVSTYYEIYAKQQGFGVVIRNRKKDAHGNTRYITLACDRQGHKKVRD